MKKKHKLLKTHRELWEFLVWGEECGDGEFRNSKYYRVRYRKEWQAHFYELFQESRNHPLSFEITLKRLYEEVERVEAVFVSKLLATINPDMPVIDSVVLTHLKRSLPPGNYSIDDRIEKINRIYEYILRCYQEYLETEEGRYLVAQFEIVYPKTGITKIKMIDLVLWQDR